MSIIRSAALVRAKKFEISVLCEEVHRIAEDGRYAAAVAIGVDEGRSVEAIASGPSDLEDRILAHQRSRFTHYYFYIRDEVLGPMVLLVASFFPFQTASSSRS